MNTVKQSLIDNQAEILASLPENDHAAFKNSLESMSDKDEVQPLTGNAAVAAIKAELKANPDVDESAAAAELNDITAPVEYTAPTDQELTAEKDTLLKEAHEMAAKTAASLDA